MKKIKIHNIILCLLLTITIYIIFNSNECIDSVNYAILLWKDKLFPTLFPFLMLSNLLIDFNFINILSKYFSSFMPKLFHLPSETVFVLIVSLFSGFPSGAKYTVELYNKEYINIEQANFLITFTHFSNPVFVLGFIGNIILNNVNASIIILIAHIVSNFIVGILLRPKKDCIVNNKLFLDKKTINFGLSLKNSIFNSFNTLFLLLGTIIFFSMINTVILNIFSSNGISSIIISGIFEMTQGIQKIELSNLSLYIKILLSTFFISFSGFSVHLQVVSIISDAKIKYKYFFFSRIIHSIISLILVSILYFMFF